MPESCEHHDKANIEWGADRYILLSIYRSVIQSRFDYGAIVYNSCRPSRLKQLNSLQLSAPTNAFRASPAAAVLCDTSIFPLDLERDLQTIPYASQIISRPSHIHHANFLDDNEFSNRPAVIQTRTNSLP
ncbi:hypothetical protein JTB14_019218 [Gonioctena quinquepunctata]|nr:hypothetical protein JTB14_019218 [Gonioctena quinquepunctata]